MKVLLLAHTDEASFLSLSEEERRAVAATFGANAEELKAANVYVEAYRPQPSSTAKVVRVVDGEATVADGVLGDPGEPLTGLYVIEVPDVESAVSWAKRHPAARMGAIEIRPVA